MSKFTKWFDPFSFPVRDGVYQRRDLFNRKVYSYWSSGFGWGVNNLSKELAIDMFQRRSFFQRMEWRGLSESPT